MRSFSSRLCGNVQDALCDDETKFDSTRIGDAMDLSGDNSREHDVRHSHDNCAHFYLNLFEFGAFSRYLMLGHQSVRERGSRVIAVRVLFRSSLLVGL